MIGNNFAPDYATHPGESLSDALLVLGISQKDLSLRTGLTEKHISEIVRGLSPITSETAIKLEFSLSIDASFWLNLQAHYDETMARIEHQKQVNMDAASLKLFPYREMCKLGWVPMANSITERVTNLLRFFGVDTFSAIERTQPVAYRKSTKHQISSEAVAAWLRQGEIEASKIQTKDFDRKKLIDALPVIRGFSNRSPKEYWDELKHVLSECGVAIVANPTLPKAPINGATKWLTPSKALVHLSIRNSFADIFWFTMFHEIGHILLGGKKDSYVDYDSEKSVDEIEADEFAQNALIPIREYKTFISKKDFSLISTKAFSDKIGVDKGIVIGRLQHDKLLDYKHLTSSRTRYEWVKKQD